MTGVQTNKTASSEPCERMGGDEQERTHAGRPASSEPCEGQHGDEPTSPQSGRTASPNPPTRRAQRVPADRTRLKLAILLVCAAAILTVAVLAPLIRPCDPYAQDLGNALLPPSSEHLAGTDRYGRDLFSRIIMGAQPSVFSTLALVALIAATGIFVGVLCGWRGSKLDTVLMRTSDVFLAFPGLVFALAIAGVLGGGMLNAVIALAAISWPKYARIARGLTLAQKSEPYMDAARLAGCTTAQLIFVHILPNVAGPLLVTAMLDIGTMMMELSGLSFLGLGAKPPVAEWGSMMAENRNLLQTSPWTVIAPGIAIFVTVMVFNLVGDTLRDWMDPAHRKNAVRREGRVTERENTVLTGESGNPRSEDGTPSLANGVWEHPNQ